MSDLDATLRDMIRAIVRDEVRAALAEREKPSEYLTTDEAAELARVHPGTIRRWRDEGKLEPHQAGSKLRFARRDLERLMRGEHAGKPDIDAMAEAAVLRRLNRFNL